MREVDVLIIGGGPAGLTAAVYSARAGAKTVVIEEKICGGQITGTPDIENMPGFALISGAELAMQMSEQAEVCGAEIIYDAVKELNFAKQEGKHHEVFLDGGEQLKARSMIIATGAGPRKLGAKNERAFDGKGIHYCALCDGAFYRDKDVVVVGGGNSAVEDVIYMSEIAKSITVVNVTDSFNAHEKTVEKMEELSNYSGVKHLHTVEEIEGDTKLTGIVIKHTETGKKETIKCDGIFVAIGRTPSTEMFKDKVQLSRVGYIKVDAKMKTNLPGVYAAGDVIEKQVRQVVTACADGAIAATNAKAYVKQFFK